MFKVIYNGEKDPVTIKDIFGETMQQLIENDADVVYLDADLMNSFGTNKPWRKDSPNMINCGIQEANMVGVAAGLSVVGKKPYVHTFGPFASRRCFDQAFLSVAYAKTSVRIVGSDEGVAAAFNGGTHMPFEDIGLMRTVPEAAVINSSDGVMFRELLKMTKDRPGLTYIRTTRKNCINIYEPGSTFELGKANTLQDGKDVTIIACGLMVSEALAAAKMLADEGVSARVIDMFTIKPLDADAIIKAAKETGAIVTTENHNILGGLGSAVCEVVSGAYPVPVIRHGVHDEFGEVGDEGYLRKRFGLTPDNIAKVAREAIAAKQAR